MIRINLLNVRKQRARAASILQISVLAVVAALSLTAATAVNFWYLGEIEAQQKSIDESAQEIARLKKIIGEVNELDQQKQRLIAQLTVIDKLVKGKRGPVRVLDELSASIPKRVWIDSFTEAGGNLTLTGLGLENSDISEFVRALRKSRYFKSVNLHFTQQQKRDGTNIYGFRLTATVDYSA